MSQTLNSSSFPYDYYKLRSKKVRFESPSQNTNKKNSRNSSKENSENRKFQTQNFKSNEIIDPNFKSQELNANYNINNTEKTENQFNFINQAKLKDLCPEDKAKIGELMKKLAQEKTEKEKLLFELEEKQNNYDKEMKKLKNESESAVLETLEIKEKFKYSLKLLKKLQEEQNLKNMKKETTEIENINKYYKISPKKDNYNSPRREILQYASGESEKMFQELKTIKNNQKKIEPEKPSNDSNQCSKSFKEIAKLKNDIDQLTASLRTLDSFSPKKPDLKIPSKESNNNTSPNPKKKTVYTSPIKIMENNNSSDISDSEFQSESSSDNNEKEIELAEKWLNSRKKKLVELSNRMKPEKFEPINSTQNNSNEKSKNNQIKKEQNNYKETPTMRDLHLTDFSNNEMNSIREYLEKKLESDSKYNNKINNNTNEKSMFSNLSTPQPQKMNQQPFQYKNTELKLEEKNEYEDDNLKNPQILQSFTNYLKDSIKEKENKNNNLMNFLNSNTDKILEEKIKEFLTIKDRILDSPKKNNDLSLEKKEKNIKNIKNDTSIQNIPMKKEFEKNCFKKKNEVILNKNNKSNLLLNENWSNSLKKNLNPINNNNIKTTEFHNENSRNEIDEVNNLLNKTEDFYENDLYDLIEEIEKDELRRSNINLASNTNKYYMKSQYENNKKEYNNNSYHETDPSLRYIQEKVTEMEKNRSIWK